MKLEGMSSEARVNEKLLNIRYAMKGPLLERAELIERELQKGVPKPFTRVVRANIGDCHALGQKPITFLRQVVCLAACPELMTSADVPDDVRERVKELLADCTSGSVGAYSPSGGLAVVRQRAARFLCARDAAPATAQDVYLGEGAADLILAVLELFAHPVHGKPSGVMLPVPQYPLFSGALAELGLGRVDYFLDEDRGWAISTQELERAYTEASKTYAVRAIVVINPGNPTGQVLSRENVEEILQFAHAHNLFILADEVYQENVVRKTFFSFKKVLYEMGAEYSSVPVASFLTLSKGWAAECGLRAACMELCGASEATRRALRATRALRQCPNLLGQCALDTVLRPPAPGEASYPRFSSERSHIQRMLVERCAAASQIFNLIPGYSCNTIEGAMFAFPRVEVPARAQSAAAERGLLPDEFYCMRLLEETGVCVVPGSGFGQAPGTFHFRTTILHELQEFHHITTSIRRFHLQFLEEFS